MLSPYVWLLLGFKASLYYVPIAVGDLLAGRSVRGSPRQSRCAKRAEYALLVANKGPLFEHSNDQSRGQLIY